MIRDVLYKYVVFDKVCGEWINLVMVYMVLSLYVLYFVFDLEGIEYNWYKWR